MPPIRPLSIFVAGHRGLVGSAVVRRSAREPVEVLTAHARRARPARRRWPSSAFSSRASRRRRARRGQGRRHPRQRDLPGRLRRATTSASSSNVIEAAHDDAASGSAGGWSSWARRASTRAMAPQPMREEHLLTGPLEPTNRAYAIAKIAGARAGRVVPPPARRRLREPDADQPLRPGRQLRPGREPRAAGADAQVPRGARRRAGRHRRAGHAVGDRHAAPRVPPRRRPRRRRPLRARAAQDDLRAAAPDGLLNVGVGDDLSIRELAELVREIVGSACEIVHASTSPTARRASCSTCRAWRSLGWTAHDAAPVPASNPPPAGTASTAPPPPDA